MKRLAVVVAAATVALGGCSSLPRLNNPFPSLSGDIGPEADAVRMRQAGAQPGLIAGYLADPATYLTRAAASDLYEIQSSQVARGRSQNRHVRSFAQRMIDHHTHLSSELAAASASAGLQPAPAPTLDPAHVEMLRQLQTTPDVDVLYVAQQRGAHHRARTLHTGYWRNGDIRELRRAARRARRTVGRHIVQLDRLERRVIVP